MSSRTTPSEADFHDPHVCVRCTERGPTCCRLEPGEEKVCFPISEMERDRILEVADDKGAFVQEPNNEPFLDNVKRLFPKEKDLADQLFPRHKFHLRLATRADGSCVFLGSRGCTLPREVRPHYCLIFPFWIMGGRLTIFTPPNCLAVEECRDVVGMLQTLEMTEAEVRLLHGRLRLAWGLPPREGMPLLEQAFSRYKKTK
jgi:Fe-S-cluster containining protein